MNPQHTKVIKAGVVLAAFIGLCFWGVDEMTKPEVAPVHVTINGDKMTTTRSDGSEVVTTGTTEASAPASAPLVTAPTVAPEPVSEALQTGEWHSHAGLPTAHKPIGG
jgi:hypothetical protein